MGDFANSFFSDDFGGKSAIKWKEREWSRYIKESEADVGRFYNLLIKYKNISNHLDVIFLNMSWANVVNKSKIFFVNAFDNDEDEYFFYGDEGFSIHKSPVFIVARGLLFFIEKICDIFVANIKEIDAKLFWMFVKALNGIKENIFLGIYLIDVGELWPAICHFKKVMDLVNVSFEALNELKKESDCDSKFTENFFVGLFDLRELAWQCITFCRNEIKAEKE